MAAPAAASHFRGATINWTPSGGNSVEFTVRMQYRRSAGWSCVNPATSSPVPCTGADTGPAVGDVVQAAGILNFGDSSSLPFHLLINFADATIANDIMEGIAVDPSQYPIVDSTIPHTYGSAGNFTAFIAACCRLDNNSYRIESIVNAGTGNNPPISNVPAVINCVQNTACTFSVPAVDPDGDALAFRLATVAESAISQPPSASISSSGIYSWDTTGQALGFYATQVLIEDLDGSAVVKSKTAADFLIRVIAGGLGQAPAFDSPPTPICGSTVNGIIGVPLSFTVQASDVDAGDVVTLTAAGAPLGSTFTPDLPANGNPVSTMFSWTPGAAGSQLMTFQATDTTSQQALCPISIEVTALPIADLSITKTDGVATAVPGGSLTYTIVAGNAGPDDAPGGASVADSFPDELTCTWTCAGEGGGACNASGAGNISEAVFLPADGSVTFTVSCTVSPAATGTISNTATVSMMVGGPTDPNPDNNSETDSDTVSTLGDYFTVTPCRAVDTRSGSPLQDGVPQTFALHGVCGIPSTARVVVLNGTVVEPTGSGDLTIYASDTTPPAFSTLPFSAGGTRALILVVELSNDAAGEVTVLPWVAGNGTADAVLDVVGYFE